MSAPRSRGIDADTSGRTAGAAERGAGAARWARLRDLLADALDRPADEQAEFLARACAGEPELHREAESLLASHLRRGPLDELVEAPLAASAVAASAARPKAPSAREGERLGRYRILRHLGDGGMGVVYEAHDDRLDRRVALKLLPWHLVSDQPARRRFLAEARAAAALDHPNICTVHEIGEAEDARLFIAMALYGGGSIRERVADGPLPLAEAVELALQAARGLEAAHARGIVHRDIKPGNLMLSSEGVLKIVDFGVARSGAALSASGPEQSSPLGTVSYMSPEQARGEPVDARTDIWSLGIVLYELLTGQRPFRGATAASVVRAILEDEPPPLTQLRTGVPDGLAGIVARCLAGDPHARFAGAVELRRSLEEVAGRLGADGAAPSSAPARSGGLAEEGERRHACVMVSLLVGYADLVERLEPARLDALQRRIRVAAEEIAARHGGVVNERAGDRIVCLFGVPTAHEDDPARAIRAARELHARVRALEAESGGPLSDLRLRLRSGVSWGPVVVRSARAGGRLYQVAGSAAELADALAGHAEDDEMLVEDDHGMGLGDFFLFEPAPVLSLRGGAVPALRVVGTTGVQSRIEASERHGLTPFAGRASELGVLAEALEGARSGAGGVVAVLGEAGAGKSRLLYEFRQALPDGIQVLQGRCQPYGARVPYLPFVQALRRDFDPSPELPVPARAEAVAHRLRSLGAEVEEHLPLYLHLLSIPSEELPVPDHLEGSALRAAIVDALATLFTLCAHEAPTLLLLEDWHWVDRASDLVLQELSEISSAHPLLAVVTLRPEQAPDREFPRHWMLLHLEPLELEAARSIVSALLEGGEVPIRLARFLHERTGGNAFFLEETVKGLRERGALRSEEGHAVLEASDELRLPATIQGVIRTRLDRLDREAREVLRVASVIGREFSAPVLERALRGTRPEPTLDRLRALALVQAVGAKPHPAYRFQHALTQEVAYDSLLERHRVRLHGRVARAIEETSEAGSPEHLDRLAYHFRRAEEWEKAVRYGRAAAEKAAALSEFTEAVEALDAALECVDRMPEERRRPLRVELLFVQERHCETLGLRDRQRAIVDELIASLEPEGPSPELAEALVRRGDLHILLRQHEEAERSLERSLALRRVLGDEEGTRKTLRSFGLLRWHQDRVREAVSFVEEALAIDRAREDLHGMAGDLSNLGSLFKALGEPERALACLEEALELVERLEARGRPMWKKRCHVLHHMANAHRALGDDERALACLEEGNRHAKAHRSSDHGAFHLTAMAHIRLRQGELEEALRLYRRSVYLARKARNTERLAQSLRILGEVLLGLGRVEEALPCLREAAEGFERLGDEPAEARMWMAAGRALERMGEAAEAAAAQRRARALYRDRGDVEGELEAAAGLARALRGTSTKLAARSYEEALDLAVRAGDRREEAALANSLAILRWERGEYEAARDGWERMLEAARTGGDRQAEGLALNNLGKALGQLGRPEEAHARLEEALEVHRSAGNRLLEAHALAARGDLELEAGRTPAALRDFRAAFSLRRELGDRPGEGWMRLALARAAAGAGESRLAGSHLARARAIAAEEGIDALASECRRVEESFSAPGAERDHAGPEKPAPTPEEE